MSVAFISESVISLSLKYGMITLFAMHLYPNFAASAVLRWIQPASAPTATTISPRLKRKKEAKPLNGKNHSGLFSFWEFPRQKGLENETVPPRLKLYPFAFYQKHVRIAKSKFALSPHFHAKIFPAYIPGSFLFFFPKSKNHRYKPIPEKRGFFQGFGGKTCIMQFPRG